MTLGKQLGDRLTVVIWLLLERSCSSEGRGRQWKRASIHSQRAGVYLPDWVHMSRALFRRYQSFISRDSAHCGSSPRSLCRLPHLSLLSLPHFSLSLSLSCLTSSPSPVHPPPPLPPLSLWSQVWKQGLHWDLATVS